MTDNTSKNIVPEVAKGLDKPNMNLIKRGIELIPNISRSQLTTIEDCEQFTGFNPIFSLDSRYLAFGTVDNSIQIWDIEKRCISKVVHAHSDTIASLAYSHKGDKLASGSFDGTIKFWDVKTGRLLRTISNPIYERCEFCDLETNNVFNLVFSVDDEFVFSNRRTYMNVGYDSVDCEPSGHYIFTYAFMLDIPIGPISLREVLMNHNIVLLEEYYDLRFVEYSPVTMIRCYVNKSYKTSNKEISFLFFGIDPEGNVRKCIIPGKGGSDLAAKFLNDEHVIIGNKSGLSLWDIEKSNIIRRINDAACKAILLSDDKSVVCSINAESNHEAFFWDSENWNLISSFPMNSEFEDVQLIPNSDQIIWITNKNILSINDFLSGKGIAQVEEQFNYGRKRISVSPNGAHVIISNTRPRYPQDINLYSIKNHKG